MPSTSFHPLQEMNLLPSYKNCIIEESNPLSGIIWEFYEFDTNEMPLEGLLCLPDSCPDMIFQLTPRYNMPLALGCFSHASRHLFPKNTTLFGIRFAAGVFHRFSNIPIGSFLGKEVLLSKTDTWTIALSHALQDAKGFSARTEIAMYFLKQHCNKHSASPVVEQISTAIVRTHGLLRINELASQLGCSDRYLRMLCTRYIGQSPKQFAETMQFQMAICHFAASPNETLEELAFQCGFLDSAHMNKIFKHLTGCAPSTFLADFSPLHAETK